MYIHFFNKSTNYDFFESEDLRQRLPYPGFFLIACFTNPSFCISLQIKVNMYMMCTDEKIFFLPL